MTQIEHINPRQFVAPRQRVVRMHPSELLPFAEDRTGEFQARVDEIASQIQRTGYQTRKHNGMSGDIHSYPPSHPITLTHSDQGSNLWNGNHRVAALNQIGYAKKVPVLVKDYRTYA